ncbi:MAG: DsbA family protein [Myxococcales bacterium]|nr:DsbA family protein [Myxococcales bacterium]
MVTERRAHIAFSYWSDPLCIWAFVAQDKLDRLLARHGEALQVSYHVVPVFGSLRWRFEQGPWAQDGVEGRVAKTAEIAARFGHPEVSGDGWRSVCDGSSWSPGAAIKAAWLLEHEGAAPAGCCERYQRALRAAFFVDGRNVVERETQLAVADEQGIDKDAVARALDDGRAMAALWEDHQRREALGIQGSPTYVFDDGRAMLYGNVSEGVIVATVDELLSGAAPGRSECG